jgi:hypothetical protein
MMSPFEFTAREKTAPGDEPKLQRLAQVFPK